MATVWLIHLGEYSVLYYPLNFSFKPARLQSKRPGFNIINKLQWRILGRYYSLPSKPCEYFRVTVSGLC